MMRRLQKLRGDPRGTIAIQFALVLLSLATLVGAALDFSQRQSAEQALVASLDSAAVATARKAMTDNTKKDELKTFAATYLKQNYTAANLKNTEVSITNSTVTISAKVEVPTMLLGVVGIKTLTSNKTVTAEFVANKKVEIALVIDTSESMKGDPLDAAKDAAHLMTDMVIRDGNDNTRMSVVPFSQMVNVGMDHRHDSWIDVPPDNTYTKEVTRVDSSASTAKGCKQEPTPCTRDGAPSTCWPWVCPSGVDPVEKTEDVTYEEKWRGCVGSRDAPRDVKDSQYNVKKIPGVRQSSTWACNSPVLPLTSDKDDIEDAIDALFVSGDTYIAPGLMWGYRTLSPDEPFAEGGEWDMSAKPELEKIIVLMSDGANTRSRQNSGAHWGNDVDLANERTKDTCHAIRIRKIKLYAVAFRVDDSTTKEILKDCATEEENFFEAGDDEALLKAFRDISSDLVEIALTQ